jgi:hypothetical protein
MILASRKNGKSFWELDDETNQRYATDEIILAMAAITGAYMPETELLARYISDEIIRHIVDFGYEELTVDEIILSMRINLNPMIKNQLGEDIVHADAPYRACVSFLAACLRNYMVLRKGMDRTIENSIKGY